MSFSLISIDNQENLEVVLSTPTKGTTNIIEDALDNEQSDENKTEVQNSVDNTQNYPNLIIFEIMACPNRDEPEWIKIQNPNNFPVMLDNWKIRDEANNQVSIPTETTMTEFGFTTITLTNNILNNSGDNISLFNPNNELVNQFGYNQCNTGISQSIEILTSEDQIFKNQEVETSTIIDTQETKKIENKKIIDLNKNKATKLIKINSFLKKTNSDKSASLKRDNYLSKQIIINHKSLPKLAIISVIIGGMILSSSQIVFYK